MVVGVCVVIFGTILALLIMERKKAKKKFEQMPQEVQEDFKAHANALYRASRRRKRNILSQSGSNWSGVDF